MDIEIIELSGLVLPEDAPVRRESPVPPEFRDARHAAVFDARTVFYDCVFSGKRGEIIITAPPLGNLWPMLRTGLRLNGHPIRRIRKTTLLRSNQLFIRAGAGGRLSVESHGLTAEIPVRPESSQVFAGKNLLVTKSRNNDPAWIAEWARFHAREQGSDGLVLFDNGSTDYTLPDLAEALRGVPDLKAVRIVHAPYPFGKKISFGGKSYALAFLQIGLLNIALRDMAAEARAVLHCDIDEMVTRRGGQTVYDAALTARVGGVSIGGSWVYPAPDAALPVPQHHNTWRAVPNRPCNRKWCAVPGGFFSRRGGWSTHAFGGGLLKLWRRAPAHPGFELVHCTGTTTGWKSQSVRFDRPAQTAHDPALADLLAKGIAPV